MSVLEDELYREIILDHYANPRNRGTMESPDVDVKGANPLCGDEIEVFLRLEDDRVAGVTFTGRGCSISQASASMMTEAIKGKTLGEVRAILDEFKTMMLGDAAAVDVEALGDLEPVDPRHHHVEQDEVRPQLGRLLQGLLAVGGHGHVVAGAAEVDLDEARDVRVVVDHEDRLGHQALPSAIALSSRATAAGSGAW